MRKKNCRGLKKFGVVSKTNMQRNGIKTYFKLISFHSLKIELFDYICTPHKIKLKGL